MHGSPLLIFIARAMCVLIAIVLGQHQATSAETVEANAQQSPSPSPLQAILSSDQLTGNWGGVRTELDNKGLRFRLYWNQYWGYHNRGRYSGSLDLFGLLDFEKLGWIPGGEFLIQAKNTHGLNVNQSVPAWGQPIDDADGDHPLFIARLWYQQSTPNDLFQLRLGYLDYQTMADRNAYANSEDKQFMNTYLDSNNAIIPLKVGPAVSLFYNPAEWISLVVGLSEGNHVPRHTNLGNTFDGDWDYVLYQETGFKTHLSTPSGKLPGHYRFGLFFDSRTSTDDQGYYLSFDQQLSAEADQSQGLGLFCRYGYSPGNRNRVKHFWSAGAQYQGALPLRNRDVVGFGVYSAMATADELEEETGYEVYYNARVTPAFALTPALQFINHPAADPQNNDAIIFTLRARLSF